MFRYIFLKTNFVYLVLAVVLGSTGLMVYTLRNEERDVLTCSRPVPMVAFLDVGQGDSIYIQDKLGESVLIDTGPKDGDVLSQIQKVTGCKDVHIDHLLLTHPDADHIGEAERLIEKGLVKEVLHNGFMNIDQPDESLTENRLEVLSVFKREMYTGSTVSLDNIKLEVLYPDANMYLATSTVAASKKKKKLDDNDFSIVTRITAVAGSTTKTFLLTGDAPTKIESLLIKSKNNIASNVLKLGHHGSKNSSSERFLGIVAPDEVVISASKDNSYNHPHEQTMQRVYEQRRKKPLLIRETFREGNIVYLLQ